MPSALSERKLVFLIGAVQFICTLDFVMVMPLGPDFAKALGIPNSDVGIIGGSYTAAAALASIAGAFFLDRFDRRRALACAFAGLVVGTAAGGLATDLVTLLAARMVAGAFSGPTMAIAAAVVIDHVAPGRRGRALGAIESAFMAATVLGVPVGLELARLGEWRTPFFAVAALGAVIAVAALSILPPQRAHLSADHRAAPVPFREVLKRRVVQLALAATAAFAIANFALFPNFSAYFQFNRGYPRDQLGLLYLLAGAIGFGTVRIAGRLADRYGAPPITAGGAVAYATVLAVGLVYSAEVIPVLPLFVSLSIAQGFRSVPMQALTSRIPGSHERARFMSAQASAMYLAQTTGAIIGTQLLTEHADGSLAGIDHVACFGVAMALVHAALSYAIDRRVPKPPVHAPHPG